MKAEFVGLVTLLVVGGGLASCANAGVSAEDAYAIGCPAADAALGGGSLGSKVAVTGLTKLRDSGQLGAEATTWADATIGLLESADLNDLPAEARALVVDGCAENGYPLQNISG
jgi:hypothetical protein